MKAVALVLAVLGLAGCASTGHIHEAHRSTAAVDPNESQAAVDQNPSHYNVWCTAVAPASVRFNVTIKAGAQTATVVYSSMMFPHDPQTYSVVLKETADAFEYSGEGFWLQFPKSKYGVNGMNETLVTSPLKVIYGGNELSYHEVNCLLKP